MTIIIIIINKLYSENKPYAIALNTSPLKKSSLYSILGNFFIKISTPAK